MTSVYLRSEDLAYREILGETVILSLELGEYFTLNEVGTEIWNMLDGSNSVKDIIEHVQRTYDVDPDKARQDVLCLIGELFGKNLITLRG